MNKWNEKEIRITVDCSIVSDILYRDVILVTDKDTEQLRDKIIYYFFDNQRPIFPVYQDRSYIQHVNWFPLSKEDMIEILNVFLDIQDKFQWKTPLEINVTDNCVGETPSNKKKHSVEFIAATYNKDSLSKVDSLCVSLHKKNYRTKISISYWGLTCEIQYRLEAKDALEVPHRDEE